MVILEKVEKPAASANIQNKNKRKKGGLIMKTQKKKNKLTKKQKKELTKIFFGGLFTIIIFDFMFIYYFIH